MKTVKRLFERLGSSRKFQEKYPEYNATDGKIHVLFVAPCMNETGYYRMILPALELNKTDSHSAIVTVIHKWDFNKQFDDYDTPVEMRLVRWAHYVVLPVMFTDVSYIIAAMREVNDSIEFVMDVDVNYHELPNYHPYYSKMTEKAKSILLSNLAQVDIMTAPNQGIINYYYQLTQQTGQEFLLYFQSYPNLLSDYTLEDVPAINRNPADKVRIGLVLDSSQADDLRTIEKPLIAILEKYKEKVELVLFGWTEKTYKTCPIFNGYSNMIWQKPVNYTSYHGRLNELSFDIALIPAVSNVYNSSGKALMRYVDFSAFAIPVIAAAISPFKKLIKDGDNGFVASVENEWTEKLEKLISNRELRLEIGKNGCNTVWSLLSYRSPRKQSLTSIFIEVPN